MPCTIRLLPIPKASARFHDFDEYDRLVEAAKASDAQCILIVLLGGEAGLRCGEMMALEWTRCRSGETAAVCPAVRLERPRHRAEGRPAAVRADDDRLAAALREHRHLRGRRVLCHSDGSPLTTEDRAGHVRRAARRAQSGERGVHVLRHTFCSHLAMRGAPARAIQELAGHQDLARRSATCTSVPPRSKARFGCWMWSAGPGNIVATAHATIANINS